MINGVIIFNTELEFREYVIQYFKDIYQIIFFKDVLENMIYFYCFFNNNTYIACKEIDNNTYSYYSDIYEDIGLRYHIDINNKLNNKSLVLNKK